MPARRRLARAAEEPTGPERTGGPCWPGARSRPGSPGDGARAALVLPVVAVGAHVEVPDRAEPAAGAAHPDEVGAVRGRHVIDAPARLPEAATPVRVLPEEEEPLVEQPDLLPRRPAGDEAGAGDPIDLDRRAVLDRERRDLALAHRVVGKQPGQGRGAPEQRAPRGRVPASGALDRRRRDRGVAAPRRPPPGGSVMNSHRAGTRRTAPGRRRGSGGRRTGRARRGGPDSPRARSRRSCAFWMTSSAGYVAVSPCWLPSVDALSTRITCRGPRRRSRTRRRGRRAGPRPRSSSR